MEKTGYGAVFYRQRDGVGVAFPDLPGCVTVGRDTKDAVLKAEEVLALHLDGMAADDIAPPPPTLPIDTLEADPDGEAIGKLWIMPRRSRAVRVTITMDQALLARVDQRASHIGATRSGFIADGARRLLDANGGG